MVCLAVKRNLCDKESWAKVTEMFHDIFFCHSTSELWFIVKRPTCCYRNVFICFS